MTAMMEFSRKHDENCCVACLGCLARVPCATLCAWVTTVAAVATCCGALIIGTDKTRALLQQDENFLGSMLIVCICVLFGMVFFATIFLMVSLVSTGRTSKQLFDSMRKNYCARAINVVSIIVMLLLQLCWVLLVCLLFIPVLFFGLVHLLYKDRGVDCINLKNYGITVGDKVFCTSEAAANVTTSDGLAADDLGHMYYKSKEAMICLGIAYCAAVLAAVSMSLFMVFASANIIYLKEGRFATYNVYRNGMQNTPGGPVTYVDTKM